MHIGLPYIFFDPTVTGLPSCLKQWVGAMSIWAPKITPVGEETIPHWGISVTLGTGCSSDMLLMERFCPLGASALKTQGDGWRPYYTQPVTLSCHGSIDLTHLYSIPLWVLLPKRPLDSLGILTSTGVPHGTYRHSETNPHLGHFLVSCHTITVLVTLDILW